LRGSVLATRHSAFIRFFSLFLFRSFPMTSSPGQAAALALYEQQRRPLFTLGTVLITPGALDMLEALKLAPLPFVLRHVAGDWGELCDEDKQANAAALTYGSRVLSAYDIPPNHRLWIITEADRSSTTLLLPEEY
jgi:hypothetical protein